MIFFICLTFILFRLQRTPSNTRACHASKVAFSLTHLHAFESVQIEMQGTVSKM